MKYPDVQFKVLVDGLKVILDHHKISPDAVFSPSDLNYLHYKVYQQKNYENNPNVIFIGDKRLLPLDNTFKLYPDGCNDDHVETAMKAAMKALSGQKIELVDKAQHQKTLQPEMYKNN